MAVANGALTPAQRNAHHLRYKPNGTGSSGTTATLGGRNERVLATLGAQVRDVAIIANSLLPNAGDLTTALAALDTFISSCHTGSATIDNQAGN